jgi:hypothetical protein
MGGRLRNGKDMGSGEEAGFSPTCYSVLRRPRRNKVKFAKLLLYHMKGSTRNRRLLAVATISNAPYHPPKRFSSKLKTNGEEDR